MSSLRNEALLETIYDEVLEELEAKEAFRPLFTQEELEELAVKIAHERFEDLQ
tara:strand:+ start:1274 stop:1432 length:159 start_codon:yes stop_codon:yes gene_type:complete